MTTTKKIIVRLACATVLGTAGVALTQVNRPQTAVVNAATTSVAARALGVDVASYQNADSYLQERRPDRSASADASKPSAHAWRSR